MRKSDLEILVENIAEKLEQVTDPYRNPLLMTNRRERKLTIIILGTGMPVPDINRAGSAAAIIYKKNCILIDCGRWVSRQIILAKIRFTQIKGLIITHLHQDHLNGWPALFMDSVFCRRVFPWQIWGPVGTTECIDAIKKFNKIDIIDRKNANMPTEGFETNITELSNTKEHSWELEGVKITCVPVDHRPDLPSFGLRFDTPEKSIVYSGDTTKSENLIKLGKKRPVDILVHEICLGDIAHFAIKSGAFLSSTDPYAVTRYHTLIPQMIEIANEIRPKKLVLTHIVPTIASPKYLVKEIKKGYDGEVICANDLDSF